MIIYGCIPKSKPKKVSKKKREQYEEWILEVSKPYPKFAKTNSTSKIKSKSSFPTYSIPAGRETPFYPSKNPDNMSVCSKPDDKIYTGDKMLGIGTLHKSNAVPVFNTDEAIDIATMRR
jgi:hypothetical protein